MACSASTGTHAGHSRKELWGEFRPYYHKSHDDIVFFMGRAIGDGVPLITFETRPYAGGTMLAMMKDQILEDRYWHTARTVGMMTLPMTS